MRRSLSKSAFLNEDEEKKGKKKQLTDVCVTLTDAPIALDGQMLGRI